MKPLSIGLLAIPLLATGPALAETMFAGAGALSCGEFAQHYRSAPDFSEGLYFAWAQGFMSGLNVNFIRQFNQYKDLSAKTLDQEQRYLRKYCDEHPLGNVIDGVIELYGTLPAFQCTPPRTRHSHGRDLAFARPEELPGDGQINVLIPCGTRLRV